MIDEWGMDKDLLICNFLFLKISSATELHLILLIGNILQISSTPRLHGDTVDHPFRLKKSIHLLPAWCRQVAASCRASRGGPSQSSPTCWQGPWVQQKSRLAKGVNLMLTLVGGSLSAATCCCPRFLTERDGRGARWTAKACCIVTACVATNA